MGPEGAAELASMLGFYYQRQSLQEAKVSVSLVGTEVRTYTDVQDHLGWLCRRRVQHFHWAMHRPALTSQALA